MFLKARIAPPGNKDLHKHGLKTDSATCPPVGIRIACSLATIFKWSIAKVDFESAFNNSCDAKRAVYVQPPRQSSHRYRYLWLLLTESYGLVNANAKRQQAIDTFPSTLKFYQALHGPQLFIQRKGGNVVAVAVKIVDDVLFVGPKAIM